jgi:hypothetical protein
MGGCPEQHGLHYLSKYKSKIEPSYRLLGQLVHDCLAYHYAAQLDPLPDWFQASNLDDQLQIRLGENDAELVPQAKEVSRAYLDRFAGDPWTPIFVEKEFKTTVGALDPHGPMPELDEELVTCQVDLGVEGNGAVWLVDYKCMGGEWGKDRLPAWTAAVERDYLWQALVNLHVVRQSIPNVKGFIVRRVKRRIPYDFDSNQIRPKQRMYDEIPRTIRYAVKRDLELSALGATPSALRRNYSMCSGKYGPCDYVDYCHAKDELTAQDVLDKNFTRLVSPSAPV